MKHSWKQELCCFETARSISDVDQVYELNERPHAKDRKNTYARTNSVDFFRDGLETSIVGWHRQEEGPLLVAWQRPLLRTTGRIETCRPAGRGGSITPRTPAYCVGDHTCDKAGGNRLCGRSSLKWRRLRPSETAGPSRPAAIRTVSAVATTGSATGRDETSIGDCRARTRRSSHRRPKERTDSRVHKPACHSWPRLASPDAG